MLAVEERGKHQTNQFVSAGLCKTHRHTASNLIETSSRKVDYKYALQLPLTYHINSIAFLLVISFAIPAVQEPSNI